MTTIKSIDKRSKRELNVIEYKDGDYCLTVIDGEVGYGIEVPRAELLTALGAVDKVDVRAAEAEALEQAKLVRTWADRAEKAEDVVRQLQRNIDYWVAQNEDRRSEIDALTATIERVRALAEKWRYKGEFGWGPWQAGEGPDPEGQFLDDAASELLAALDPKPAFELPTEAGVKFYAEDADGDSGIFTTLVGGTEPLYLYDDDQDYVYTGPELASWQNFRLLDGGAA